MASIEVNATASISANGTSTANGTITWTAPSLPDDVASWDSIYVSGSWSWNGKGTITSVTVGGVDTANGTPFDVNITGKTSPLAITCRGGNKNATGNSFIWSNLKVTYNYSPAKSIYIKESGSWTQYNVAYKKVNGAWVLQSNLADVFDPNVNYVKG